MEMFSQAFQGVEHEPFLWPGDDRAALVVHGFPGTPSEMRPVAQALHQAGWTVQAILLPGFGPQLGSIAEKTHHDWAQAVQDTLASLKRDYKTVLLVGLSLGGALALRAAAAESPAALVLLAPFWKLEHALWPIVPVIRRATPSIPIFRLLTIDFNDPETRQGIHKMVPQADLDDPQVQQQIRSFRLPVRLIDELRQAGQAGYRAVPHITAPVLIIQGTEDDLVLPRLTRRLLVRFGGTVQYHELCADHQLTRPEAAWWPEVEHRLLVFADIVKSTQLQ
jgi:esterase/lipase